MPGNQFRSAPAEPMSNSDTSRTARRKTGVAKLTFASIRSRLRRIWTSRRRALSSASPIYYSDIKSLTSDEWRGAFAENPATAARWVYAAATHGEIQAQILWGQMLLDGYQAERDPDGAYRWFSIASKSGRADAINMVGRCHEKGWGVPVDYSKAAAYYAEAAGHSYDWALFNLACLMLEGNGVPRDPDRAFALFKQAVEQGHGKSLNMIGHCHEHGLGCERNMTIALDWYHRSAHAGDFRGQYRYGQLLYEMGRIDESVSWFQRAVTSAPPAIRTGLVAELSQHTDRRLHNMQPEEPSPPASRR